MKIQPINIDSPSEKETVSVQAEPVKPVIKSLFKRLFDRQYPRTSAVEKPNIGETQFSNKDGTIEFEFEPSSICLDKMVQNFIEDSQINDNKQQTKYGRNHCNCFNGNGNGNDSSDEEFDVSGESINGGSSPTDTCESLKSLVQCATVVERNLLADTSTILKRNKNCKRKEDLKNIVTDGLVSLGYNSSICKSKWEKSPFYPAGDYEYIDVIVVDGERMLIDVDFRSEFEMARSTGTYRAIVSSLPFVFVGKPERLDRIVTIVSEAAKLSLKNKGMHLPPWRKVEYMRAKWLSQFTRDDGVLVETETETASSSSEEEKNSGEVESPAITWQLPAVKPKSVERGTKVVTGLASLFKEKP